MFNSIYKFGIKIIYDKQFIQFFRYTIKTAVDDEYVKDSAPFLSHRANDLKMGVTSFCKAFPWHLVLDKRLEFVQLGSGFMKLFGKCLQQFGKYNICYNKNYYNHNYYVSITYFIDFDY